MANAKKCQFLHRQLKYLGHTTDGFELDHDKTEVLKNWKVPQNRDDLRSFLGFTG